MLSHIILFLQLWVPILIKYIVQSLNFVHTYIIILNKIKYT